MPSKRMSPKFGSRKSKVQGLELEEGYIIPNYSLRDLVIAFDRASKSPDASPFAANPSLWPTTMGVRAVVDICIEELYNKRK